MLATAELTVDTTLQIIQYLESETLESKQKIKEVLYQLIIDLNNNINETEKTCSIMKDGIEDFLDRKQEEIENPFNYPTLCDDFDIDKYIRSLT